MVEAQTEHSFQPLTFPSIGRAWRREATPLGPAEASPVERKAEMAASASGLRGRCAWNRSASLQRLPASVRSSSSALGTRHRAAAITCVNSEQIRIVVHPAPAPLCGHAKQQQRRQAVTARRRHNPGQRV